MKPPYSGNRCLKGLFIHNEAKSMQGFMAFKEGITVLFWCRLQIKTLCDLA
jgi:hypothetical protein